jgi:CRISPR/Cas system endoribonuclease Cas6 (RAMP superfamily)
MRRFQFSLQAINSINLPSYKGSAFHGGFGHALETLSPTWFAYFFQPENQHGNTIPKPFVLLPPLDQQQSYQAGEPFQCELTLFAEATQHYAIVQAAIEYLGNKLGLGYNRGKFKIIEITESTTSTNTPINPQILSLNFITRLRLKTNNKLQKQSPDFPLLLTRLFGRLKTLQQSYSSTPINQQHYQQLLHQSKEIQTLDSNLHWDDWARYSGRQKEWMKFGGLLGEIRFQGNLQPFIPYLQMGELCHIGGKTSFGLGKYTIDYGEV